MDNYVKNGKNVDAAALSKGFANEEFWEVAGRYQFKIKPNKKPSDAINAFLKGPTIAECGNAIIVCQLAALLKIFGPEKFDAIFYNNYKPITISQIICDERNISSFFFDYGDKKSPPTKGSVGNRPIKEGEMCHFANLPDYLIKHPAGFVNGFNVISVGKNENGEDLILGFGPNTFVDKPLTERELAIKFIEFYNVDRNIFDQEHISSSKNPGLYDMKMHHTPERLSFDEGVKNIQGYLPGSVITPQYERIDKYLKMETAKTPDAFVEDYATNLFLKADELMTTRSPYLHMSSLSYAPVPLFFKRQPYIYTAEKEIEKLKDNHFGWTRQGKRYIFDQGKMYKFVPDPVREIRQENMTAEEISEFKQALEEQSSRLATSKPRL